MEHKQIIKNAVLDALINSKPTFGEALDVSEWLYEKVKGCGLRFLRQETAQEALKELLEDRSI